MIDVIIIGGGPAGISAGTVLQKKGYKTCIVDTKVFPRKKLCAGVLTVKSRKLLQSIFKDLKFENMNMKDINKIELLYNCRLIGKYTVNNAYSVIDRTEFDYNLLQYYKAIGGLVFDGQKNYSIDYDKNTVKLSSGEKIQYNFLIGADGINSKVRSYVKHTWRASILCFEEFVPNVANEDIIKINFGGILGGYSWRIPGKEQIGVGLGEFYIKGMKRKSNKYKKYFKSQGISEVNNIKGAFVSCGNFIRKPIKNNVLLVGDAAGLVDAMTGEGIYFAIASGHQAALAIIDNIKRRHALGNYVNRMKGIHRKMREQNIYNKVLYVPLVRLISLRYMKKNPKFVQRVLENTVSTYCTGYTKEVKRSKNPMTS